MNAKSRMLIMVSIVVVMLLAACQPVAEPAAAEPEQDVDAGETVEEAAEPEEAVSEEEITLEFYHWFGADLGDTFIKDVNDQFHALYPNVTVEFETADTDTYEQVITTRLSANDAPDIFGVFPGTKFHPIAEAGYLMDLSNEAWVANLLDGAKFVSSYDGKVMTMPVDANVIGVIYNKQIFADLGLDVPTDWEEFLAACETIKASGVAPLAVGLGEGWITQLIPYAMAPSAIYRDNMSFDASMYAGEAAFVGSAWEQMMADYLELEAMGYFNADPLGTGYDLANDMMANGESAIKQWIKFMLEHRNPDFAETPAEPPAEEAEHSDEEGEESDEDAEE